MNQTTQPARSNEKQIHDDLSEIVSTIHSAKKLIGTAINNNDRGAVLHAIEAMMCQAGYLADTVLRRTGQEAIVGDFEQWLRIGDTPRAPL